MNIMIVIKQAVVLIGFILLVCISEALSNQVDYLANENTCPPHKDEGKWLTQYERVAWGIDNRAVYTIPPEIQLEFSSIPKAGLGIFATTFISKYTWLGQYEGDIVVEESAISDYAWTVYQGGYLSHYVDAVGISCSNWLRWVNSARHVSEQNVMMTSCHGQVYYILFKDVRPGDELLTYYGHKYGQYLGLDVASYYNSNVTLPLCGEREVCCKEDKVHRIGTE